MQTIKIYACDICRQQYATEQEARICEKRGSAKDGRPLYQPGDRVLVKSGSEAQKRTIVAVETEHRHLPEYLLDECAYVNGTLLIAQKMNGYYTLYPKATMRYAQYMDLRPDIPDVTQYIMKMLPGRVEHEGDVYTFRLTNDYGQIQFGYIADLPEHHKYHSQGPFGGPAGTLCWYAAIETDDDMKVRLLNCRHFLEGKKLLQF